jgi:hypothetical protein
LSRFFGLITKYNNGRPLKRSHILELENFFEFYWANDKLSSLQKESDLRFFDELPENIRIELFKNFLFGEFVRAFKHFFVIRKNLR